MISEFGIISCACELLRAFATLSLLHINVPLRYGIRKRNQFNTASLNSIPQSTNSQKAMVFESRSETDQKVRASLGMTSAS
jgi:hypothetical protein